MVLKNKADHPLITVVIPAYNAQKTIKRAVESVLFQTYPNVEVLIIDDGSKNGYEVVLEDVYTKVRIIKQSNKGAASARNKGIEEARGEYLAFLDSDDEYDSTFLEKVFYVIGEADIAMTGIEFLRDGAEHSYRQNAVRNTKDLLTAIEAFFCGEITVGIHGKLFRRSVLIKHRVRFPEGARIGEDAVFIFRYLVVSEGKIRTIGECLYFVHNTPDSLCNSYSGDAIYVMKALDFMEWSMRKRKIFDGLRESYIRYYLDKVKWLLDYSNRFYAFHKGGFERKVIHKMRYSFREMKYKFSWQKSMPEQLEILFLKTDPKLYCIVKRICSRIRENI